VSPSQIEAQHPSYLVHVGRPKRNDFLTSALRHPHLLTESVDFALTNERFVRKAQSEQLGSQWALMLIWKHGRSAIVAMVAVVTLLSVLAGVLVGVLNHDASLGIAVSSGLAAVLSCLEVLVVWQFR